MLSHIVAVSKNWVIGKDNGLPWSMPEDSRYFHDVTMGHIVIMGRKNYEANKGALKGRLNVVISRNKEFNPPDALVVSSIEDALNMESNPEIHRFGSWPTEEIFIVGGGEIYSQTLDLADRIYLTIIDTQVEGDSFYPEIQLEDYHILSEDPHKANKDNPFEWRYYVLEKAVT